jgi:predicted TIM-barrel fold metal-dependent hydrolase
MCTVSRAGIDLGVSLLTHSRAAHVVPGWYHALVPTTGQSPTPNWTIETQFNMMQTVGIRKSVLSISAPGTTVYVDDEAKATALARLLNEYLAALSRTYPSHFGFFAVTPLPYVDAAIREARYALDHLGAAGIGLLSNHEGYYLGNAQFKPFFTFLNSYANTSASETIFVHPNEPCLRIPNGNGSLIIANPTVYPDGLVELYFESARTFMDLTLTSTLSTFSRLNFVVPHAGGSFPSIISRMLSRLSPAAFAAQLEVFKQRLWWDTAGPTFPYQVKGLLAYGIGTDKLLLGTDYPYVPGVPVQVYRVFADEVGEADFLNVTEKDGVYHGNAEKLFGARLG